MDLKSELARALRTLIRLGLSITSLQFIMVGSLALLFAEALLYLMIDGLSLNRVASVIITTEASVLLNFALNDNWTFKRIKKGGGGLYRRIIKFHASRISSITLNILLFILFAEVLLLHYLLAYLLAAVIAFMFNFVTSFVWVWRAHTSIITGKEEKREIASR